MTAVRVETWWAANSLRCFPYQDSRSTPFAMAIATIGNQARTYFHMAIDTLRA